MPWGPLSFWARCGACACGWGRAGLGAARRGSAVGYFNERCQGLQRGEERREKPGTLSKLGLGRGGLARCCGGATATHSAPARTPAPLRIRSRGLFPTTSPFLILLVPLPHVCCFCLCWAGDGGGTWGERQLLVCSYGLWFQTTVKGRGSRPQSHPQDPQLCFC